MRLRNLIDGEEVGAVVFEGVDTPGMEVREQEVPVSGSEGGQTQAEFLIFTKDAEGDGRLDSNEVTIALGTYVFTHEDGTVSLCHPSVVERDWEEVV